MKNNHQKPCTMFLFFLLRLKPFRTNLWNWKSILSCRRDQCLKVLYKRFAATIIFASKLWKNPKISGEDLTHCIITNTNTILFHWLQKDGRKSRHQNAKIGTMMPRDSSGVLIILQPHLTPVVSIVTIIKLLKYIFPLMKSNFLCRRLTVLKFNFFVPSMQQLLFGECLYLCYFYYVRQPTGFSCGEQRAWETNFAEA